MPGIRETRLPEFERDLKKLRRRFSTLEGDLTTLLMAQIAVFHRLNVDNKGVFRLTGLPFENPEVYKVKKFACRALKGRGADSGLRLIYAFFRAEDRIELVELYFKGDKENEDRERILMDYGMSQGKRD